MSIIKMIERRANRAHAEEYGLTLIEDLPLSEQKAILNDMEVKARYVRTAAGVARFKRPIGAIILPRGGSLDRIRIKDPVFKGFDLVEDRQGNLYDVGKDDSTGKFVALKHNSWDDQIKPQDSLDDALEALNEKLGGGTNSDRVEGEKPAPKTKKPAPKKAPAKESSKTPAPQDDASSNAVTRDTPIGTPVRVAQEYNYPGKTKNVVGQAGTITRRNKNGVTVQGKDGIFTAPYDALEVTSKADVKRSQQAGGASKDLDLLDRQAEQLRKTMERMESATTMEALTELDRDFTVQRARQRVKADEIIKNPRTSDEDRKRAQGAKDRVSKLDDDEIALLERKKKGLSAPKAKPASIGGQGSKERDAFIESHPKIKAVDDYHKPKLRDMTEKNFQAYVDAVEGGKSANSIGPIMSRIDAGASWNPVTEKWSGQGSASGKRPTAQGDTSASDAADAAVRDRVKKMKDADRSQGRTNPYTSSLKPHQKDEVDALTPGEYATYMNARDDGHGHQGAVHRAKNQPKVTYFGALRDADDAITNAKKNLSPKQTPEEQEYELKNRQKRLQEANAELGRHRAALPAKLDQMTSEQRAQEKEILAKYQAIDDADSAINRKRASVMKKREQDARRVSDDAARTEKNREARASAEVAGKFGNTATFLNANQDLLKKIVSLGRSGKNPEPHLPEVRERLAEIDNRLSWTDDELGGYHKGKGKAESDEAAAKHRANLRSQRERYQKAVELMESQSKPKPKTREEELEESRDIMKMHETANYARRPFTHAENDFTGTANMIDNGRLKTKRQGENAIKNLEKNIAKREEMMADKKRLDELLARDVEARQRHLRTDKARLEKARAKVSAMPADKEPAPYVPDSLKPKVYQDMFGQDITTPQQVAQEISGLQENGKTVRGIRTAKTAHGRINVLRDSIEALQAMHDDKSSPMTERQRSAARTAISYGKNAIDVLTEKYGDPSKGIEAPTTERANPFQGTSMPSGSIGGFPADAIYAPDGLPIQGNRANGNIPAAPKGRQKTYVTVLPNGEVRMENSSRDYSYSVVGSGGVISSHSTRAAALKASNSPGYEGSQVVPTGTREEFAAARGGSSAPSASYDPRPGDPGDGPFRRGASKLRKAGIEDFRPNDARRLDELKTTAEQQEVIRKVKGGMPIARALAGDDDSTSAPRNPSSGQTSTPGSTTQAVWGTSTHSTLTYGGPESDDPILRAVERGEISIREAQRRREAAQQSQSTSSITPDALRQRAEGVTDPARLRALAQEATDAMTDDLSTDDMRALSRVRGELNRRADAEAGTTVSRAGSFAQSGGANARAIERDTLPQFAKVEGVANKRRLQEAIDKMRADRKQVRADMRAGGESPHNQAILEKAAKDITSAINAAERTMKQMDQNRRDRQQENREIQKRNEEIAKGTSSGANGDDQAPAPFSRRLDIGNNVIMERNGQREPGRVTGLGPGYARVTFADGTTKDYDPTNGVPLDGQGPNIRKRTSEESGPLNAQERAQEEAVNALVRQRGEALREASEAMDAVDFNDSSPEGEARLQAAWDKIKEAERESNDRIREMDSLYLTNTQRSRLSNTDLSTSGRNSTAGLLLQRLNGIQNRRAPIVKEERERRLKEAEAAGDTLTAIATTKELEAAEMSNALGQSARRQEIKRKWDRRRDQIRKAAEQRTAQQAQGFTPATREEYARMSQAERAVERRKRREANGESEPKGATGEALGTRLPSVDSTLAVAKTQMAKARRVRSERSAQDAIHALNNTERDLKRDLTRSGDRMTSEQRADIQRALTDINSARRKAEEQTPVERRTTIRPSDLPALNERNSQNRDYREVARNRATSEALGVFDSLPTSIPDGSTYGPQELDRAALANMDDAPSVPALNRAIRALEEQEDTTVDDEIRVLKEARDYLKERADQDRAEFEAANDSLFGDDFSIPERSTPAGQSEDRSGGALAILKRARSTKDREALRDLQREVYNMEGGDNAAHRARGEIMGKIQEIINGTYPNFKDKPVRTETGISREEAAQRYANTPSYDIDEAPVGRAVHIGGGQWVHRCSVCGKPFVSNGTIVYDQTRMAHEASHGGQVPGYNVGILS